MASWQSLMGSLQDENEYLEAAIDSSDFAIMLGPVIEFRNKLTDILYNPRNFLENEKNVKGVTDLCLELRNYWLNREIDVTGSFHWYT